MNGNNNGTDVCIYILEIQWMNVDDNLDKLVKIVMGQTITLHSDVTASRFQISRHGSIGNLSGRHGICSPHLSGLWMGTEIDLYIQPLLCCIASFKQFFLGCGVIPVSRFGSLNLLVYQVYHHLPQYFMAIFQTSPGHPPCPSFPKVAPEVPMKGFLRWELGSQGRVVGI